MNLTWRRVLYDWEMDDYVELINRINGIAPCSECAGGISWHGLDYCSIPIKDIADRVFETFTPILPKQVSLSIWKTSIPPRAQLTL